MASQVQAKPEDRVNVTVEGSYQGKPTCMVGPENMGHQWAINAGCSKWRTLFTPDRDGDINAINVLKFLQKNDPHFDSLRPNLDRLIEQLQELANPVEL